MWRICNNALPTLVNLHRRHIIPNASYALCNDLLEDTLHAVWSCQVISGVWLEWFHQSVPSQPSFFSELLSRLLFCQEEFRVEIFVTIAWFLWNRRNVILFGRPALPVLASAVKQGVFCKGFFKLRRRSLFHPVHLQCCSGALLNLIAIR